MKLRRCVAWCLECGSQPVKPGSNPALIYTSAWSASRFRPDPKSTRGQQKFEDAVAAWPPLWRLSRRVRLY